MTHRSFERLVAFLALLCACSFMVDSNISAQESSDATSSSVDVDQASAGSPCYVNEDGELVCEAPAAVESTEAEVAKPAIDLTTQPWLVESANLPANHPALKREHMIWADSNLWVAIDDIIDGIPVEKWLTQSPTPEDLAGKYVLVEVWATWCPPCRRSLPYLNYIAGKYKDDLVVVSICEMDENAIRNMPGPGLNIFELNYFAAVDTGRRFANKLGVYGIPHAVLLEPTIGGVVWEGMPTLPRYELDDKKLEKFFSIGHKLKEAGRLPEKSPIRFVVSEPTAEDRASRRRVSSKDVEETVGAPSL
ncbi:MAG: TlpA disulfide reductase family protein [Planctomycetia bacterium]|nr:TlpA disulfide reductase family protein [Planctomycetia bacterium]